MRHLGLAYIEAVVIDANANRSEGVISGLDLRQNDRASADAGHLERDRLRICSCAITTMLDIFL